MSWVDFSQVFPIIWPWTVFLFFECFLLVSIFTPSWILSTYQVNYMIRETFNCYRILSGKTFLLEFVMQKCAASISRIMLIGIHRENPKMSRLTWLSISCPQYSSSWASAKIPNKFPYPTPRNCCKTKALQHNKLQSRAR